MADDIISVSVVVNAPVERVWPLLIEHIEVSRSQAQESLQSDPPGPPVAGQVIHMEPAFLRIRMHVDRVVPLDPPMTGETIYAKMSFFSIEGNMVGRLSRDVEHYHFQAQGEIKHPWFHLTGCTDMRCIAIDTTSCTIQHLERSELNIRLIPRWMARILNSDKTVKKATADGIEKSLQEVKVKAERGQDEW
jgi:hypothetical protein